MTHYSNKELQEASLVGRILSIETFLMLMGGASLLYGIANDQTMSIFWGIVIIPGVFLLQKIRKRDWTKHWQEMEAEQEALKEHEMRRREAAEAALKEGTDAR